MNRYARRGLPSSRTAGHPRGITLFFAHASSFPKEVRRAVSHVAEKYGGLTSNMFDRSGSRSSSTCSRCARLILARPRLTRFGHSRPYSTATARLSTRATYVVFVSNLCIPRRPPATDSAWRHAQMMVRMARATCYTFSGFIYPRPPRPPCCRRTSRACQLLSPMPDSSPGFRIAPSLASATRSVAPACTRASHLPS